MAYIIVPEMHKDGAWHFHGLFANMGDSIFKVATNNDKDSPYYGQPLRVCYPDGDYIYNLSNYKWGFTTATKIRDCRRSASYLLKYITKELCAVSKGLSRYHASRNLPKPQKTLYMVEPHEVAELVKYCEYNGYDVYKKVVDVVGDGYDNRITYYEVSKGDGGFDTAAGS